MLLRPEHRGYAPYPTEEVPSTPDFLAGLGGHFLPEMEGRIRKGREWNKMGGSGRGEEGIGPKNWNGLPSLKYACVGIVGLVCRWLKLQVVSNYRHKILGVL